MRKTIALFLAMLMVLSLIPLAFAENETEGGGVVVIIGGDDSDDNETVEPECVEDADCGEGEICSEGVCEVEIPEEVTEEAGITPDSPLYGLERAMERISLALTFGKSAKAKKGLAHAHERLMEVQAMIAAKKLAKAQVAEEGYEEAMEEVEENLEEIGDGDGEQELADNVEIEDALAENQEALEAANQIRLKVSKSLGEAEKAQIQTMLQSLEGINSAFKVKVQANKNKAKIKIKAGKGATDEEIATLENALKQGKELAGVRITKKGAGVVKKEKPAKVNNKNKNKGSSEEPEAEGEAEEEEAECVEDADCEEGKVCVEGACEDAVDEEPESGDNETED